MNCLSVCDVLGPHTYLSSPVFLAGNDSRMMKVSDVAHCRRIDFPSPSLVLEWFAPHVTFAPVGPRCVVLIV